MIQEKRLLIAIKNITLEELVAAERLADAQLTLTFLRRQNIPTQLNILAHDCAQQDCKLIAESLRLVKNGAGTCQDR